ncbi:hypothetical protein [Pelagibacterium halotolerans]|uniref:phage tail assembly chaperone n=1 Tax=Pelagibacterium halotolerans TaxID=531813 RepID=UPI00384DDAE4
MALSVLLADALRDHLNAPGTSPHIPEPGLLAWRWFLDLCRTRTHNGTGPNPISHAEIEAYARLYRWPLKPHHVDQILALDRIWIEHAYRQQRRRLANQPSANDPTLDRGAFDAVFG